MEFSATKIDIFLLISFMTHTNKLVPTLVAFALQSLEAQPLSIVESVHEPFGVDLVSYSATVFSM